MSMPSIEFFKLISSLKKKKKKAKGPSKAYLVFQPESLYVSALLNDQCFKHVI